MTYIRYIGYLYKFLSINTNLDHRIIITETKLFRLNCTLVLYKYYIDVNI
jgi:hypothetical protein